MINFSIIIPHKNIPSLLEDCILSIPKRDDVQIIVVDDHSNEETLEQLHFMERRLNQSRLSFVYLDENQAKGAGHARNIGLSQAIGKWVVFADSDDTFETETINAAFDNYAEDENDIIYFSINCLDVNTKKPMSNADRMYISHLCAENDAENRCRYKIQVPWGKFVKRNLIEKHSIKFDETKVGNDAWFALQVGYYANGVKIDFAKIYNWMVRSGSITSNKNEEALLVHIRLASKLNYFKESHGLSKYRANVFAFIPMLMRAKVSVIRAVLICVKNTSNQYIVKDIVNVIKMKLA